MEKFALGQRDWSELTSELASENREAECPGRPSSPPAIQPILLVEMTHNADSFSEISACLRSPAQWEISAQRDDLSTTFD
jgi:hypothetical protein